MRKFTKTFAITILLIFVAFAISQNNRGVIRKNRYKTSDGDNKWAVIIGINQYDDSGINDLKYAVNDAQKLYDLLTNPKIGGFEKSKVVLITDNTDRKPTRTEILTSLTILENVDPKDTIFIYFS